MNTRSLKTEKASSPEPYFNRQASIYPRRCNGGDVYYDPCPCEGEFMHVPCTPEQGYPATEYEFVSHASSFGHGSQRLPNQQYDFYTEPVEQQVSYSPACQTAQFQCHAAAAATNQNYQQYFNSYHGQNCIQNSPNAYKSFYGHLKPQSYEYYCNSSPYYNASQNIAQRHPKYENNMYETCRCQCKECEEQTTNTTTTATTTTSSSQSPDCKTAEEDSVRFQSRNTFKPPKVERKYGSFICPETPEETFKEPFCGDHKNNSPIIFNENSSDSEKTELSQFEEFFKNLKLSFNVNGEDGISSDKSVPVTMDQILRNFLKKDIILIDKATNTCDSDIEEDEEDFISSMNLEGEDLELAKQEEVLNNIDCPEEPKKIMNDNFSQPYPTDELKFVQCPHCSRKFEEKGAERHIRICQDFKNFKEKINNDRAKQFRCIK